MRLDRVSEYVLVGTILLVLLYSINALIGDPVGVLPEPVPQEWRDGQWECEYYKENTCSKEIYLNGVCFVDGFSIHSRFVEGDEIVSCKAYCDSHQVWEQKTCVSWVWSKNVGEFSG